MLEVLVGTKCYVAKEQLDLLWYYNMHVIREIVYMCFWFGEQEDLAVFYFYFPFDKDSGFGCMAYKDSILALSIFQVWFGLCLSAKC